MKKLEILMNTTELNSIQTNLIREAYRIFVDRKSQILNMANEHYKEQDEKHKAYAATVLALLVASEEVEEDILANSILDFLNKNGVYNMEECTFIFFGIILSEALMSILLQNEIEIMTKILEINGFEEKLSDLDEDCWNILIEVFEDEFMKYTDFLCCFDSVSFIERAMWQNKNLGEVVNVGEKYLERLKQYEYEDWSDIYQLFCENIFGIEEDTE